MRLLRLAILSVALTTFASAAPAQDSSDRWCDDLFAALIRNLELGEFSDAASTLQYPDFDFASVAAIQNVRAQMAEAFRVVVRELGQPGDSKSVGDPGDLESFGVGPMPDSYWMERDPKQNPVPRIAQVFRSADFAYDGQIVVAAICASEGSRARIRRVWFRFPKSHPAPEDRMFELTRRVSEVKRKLVELQSE